jgi:hypothetical protein
VNAKAPVETALVGDVATAVDAGIVKISVVKRRESGGFASTGGSDDVDEG